MFARLKRLIANNGEKNQIEALELKKTGDKHIGEERYEQAVEYYRQALSLYPEFSDALIGHMIFVNPDTTWVTLISPTYVLAIILLSQAALFWLAVLGDE